MPPGDARHVGQRRQARAVGQAERLQRHAPANALGQRRQARALVQVELLQRHAPANALGQRRQPRAVVQVERLQRHAPANALGQRRQARALVQVELHWDFCETTTLMMLCRGVSRRLSSMQYAIDAQLSRPPRGFELEPHYIHSGGIPHPSGRVRRVWGAMAHGRNASPATGPAAIHTTRGEVPALACASAIALSQHTSRVFHMCPSAPEPRPPAQALRTGALFSPLSSLRSLYVRTAASRSARHSALSGRVGGGLASRCAP